MKNSNKNNIKIFDKHKSNIVGVGVLDDPKTKQKHTNKIMSNKTVIFTPSCCCNRSSNL